MPTNQELNNIASQVRRDIIRMVTSAQSGHPGGSLSSADILTALFFSELKHSPAAWSRDGKGNDMFFLSAGHISPVFYSVLARSGYFPVSELATFRQFGSRLQGHPSVEKGLPGVYSASGSLGQGLSVATGAALAKKADKEQNYVYVLMGDGESEEGQVWEAAAFAAHNKVNNLIAITDWNKQQIDGTTEEVFGLGDLEQKWRSFGWNVVVADGHDMEAILSAFKSAKELEKSEEKPVMILMKTNMGKGVDFMEGTCAWHGKAPKPQEAEKALAQIKETLGDY
ncbi:MAG: transketolase [Bacteroidales bacterium]|nr:transketolase [Bacteroidales bacterium]MBQ3522109.1 transketolase [Bacteroidales bacterium]MBQ6871476.1 transketolase [Bacteroidales bacterium]MBQ7998662.1 transketolase [Bacteroidales bacterium]MBQ8034883.1 transketolase [Bacteroidales bacterium]